MARIVLDTGIHRLLRERYPAPAWAIFFEVASGTGRQLSRYADAIAMSLFPSRGLDFNGFEIKEHRKDWLVELKNPQKADEIASYCDFWWLVLGDASVARPDEIPRTWGVLVQEGKGLVQKKAPQKLKAKPIDRSFIAALLRRAHEMAEREKRRADDKFAQVNAVKEAYKKGMEEGKEDAEIAFKRAAQEHESLKKSLAEFEEKSGLEIESWGGGRLGDAVETLRWLKRTTSTEALDSAASGLETAAADLRKKSQSLKEVPEQIPPRLKPLQEPVPNGKLSP